MGYTTDFSGEFKLDKPLTIKQKNTLDEFADERHGGNTEVYDGFPGFWCQWVPNSEGTALQWDGGEKFYDYVEWLEFLIKNFIEPWGLKLNGEVKWFGEERDDIGLIIVNNNKVTTSKGTVSYDG